MRAGKSGKLARRSLGEGGSGKSSKSGKSGLSGPSGLSGLWILWPLLALVTLAAYAPALRGGVLWDDDRHLTSAALQSVDGLRRIWTELGATQQYYPIVHSAFWLMHRLWGDATFGYHVVNIVLHACSAWLVFVILQRLKIPGALLAATVFALHPVQVESVAWMTELKNVLSGLFYLLAALAYLTFDQTRRPRAYTIALVLFACALLSKSVTATLPAALLVVFWWQRGRLDWRRDVRPLVPFIALGVASGVFTVWVERVVIGASGAEYQYTFIERTLIASRAILFYLTTLAWPSNLTFIYPRWTISQADASLYLYVAGVIAVTALLWLIRRRTRAPLAGWLFFCGTLFPALGFFNVYPFRYSFVADHFQYLASLGLITLASAGAATLLTRVPAPRRRIVAAVAVVVVVVGLGTMTRAQSRDYQDADTLYSATIARNPTCWMAHNNLGELILNRPDGDLKEAARHFNEALRLKPDHAAAYSNLGVIAQKEGRFTDALAAHQAAVTFQPIFPDAHYNLGIDLQNLGRAADAQREYEEALRENPAHERARYNLGMLLQQTGDIDQALDQLTTAVRANPNSPEARVALGMALQRLRRTNDAIAQYREALKLKPDASDARNNLGAALVSQGKIEEAVHEYEEAVRLLPGSAMAQTNFGYALAKLGRIDEAERHLREALRLEPGNQQAHYALANLLQQTGRLDEALPEFRAALEHWTGPSSASVHNDYGVTLARRGRLDEAAAEFREALRLRPDHPDARANLEKIKKPIK